MKVVAFCGSARKGGNTALLLKTVLEPLNEIGAETELVELAGREISGCKACMGCFEKKDQRCVFDNDVVNECIEKWLLRMSFCLVHPHTLLMFLQK